VEEVIQLTDCTSTIDIASTRQRCSSPLAIRNHRTSHAELTVRFPPFSLYEFAVMRSVRGPAARATSGLGAMLPEIALADGHPLTRLAKLEWRMQAWRPAEDLVADLRVPAERVRPR
jgi:hypothetical protein